MSCDPLPIILTFNPKGVDGFGSPIYAFTLNVHWAQKYAWLQGMPGHQLVGILILFFKFFVTTPMTETPLDRDRQTDKHLWKHYLPITSFGGGKKSVVIAWKWTYKVLIAAPTVW